MQRIVCIHTAQDQSVASLHSGSDTVMLGLPGVWSDHNQEKWCNANIARPSKNY